MLSTYALIVDALALLGLVAGFCLAFLAAALFSLRDGS